MRVGTGQMVMPTDELLACLNDAENWRAAWKRGLTWTGALAVVVGFFVPWLFVLALVAFLAVRFGPRHRVVLEYELDDALSGWFARLTAGWPELARTGGRWRLVSSRPRYRTHDRKINALSAAHIGRSPATFQLSPPWPLEVNMAVPSIESGGHYLVFLPDRILVREDAAWTAVEYAGLTVSVSESAVSESGAPPDDGVKINEVWARSNVDGGRDRRYNDNWLVPVMLYYQARVSSDTGFRCVYLLSRRPPADWWEAALRERPFTGFSANALAAGAGDDTVARLAVRFAPVAAVLVVAAAVAGVHLT